MTGQKKIFLAVFIIGLILLRVFNVFQYLSIDRIQDLSDWINGFGLLAPAIFVTLYVLATVLVLPGLPLTLLSGLIFGPYLGTLYVSLASTIGASLAFIIGRYLGREAIEKRFADNALFSKLDQGVENQGWKMVAITRLVPVFPFNAQNFMYGLTKIPFMTYAFVSWLCMLPATFAYVALAGSILAGNGNATTTVVYIGVAVALIILLSIVGKYIMNKENMTKD